MWQYLAIHRTAEVHAALRSGCHLHLRRNGSDVARESLDGLEAKEPGRCRPVKAASRRSRARLARALTGLRRSGSGSPGDHGSDLLSIGVIQARGAPDAMENLGAACFLDRGSTSTPRVVPWQAVQKRCADRCLRPKPTGRTSRLLSCHLSVGGRLPAVPTRCFAKLRSDMTQILRLGSSFGAGSLQAMC